MTDNIKKLIEANKWRPIEEAPRDGTYVLLRGDSGYIGTPYRYIVARHDVKYRPLQPWVTHANDSVLDDGKMPTHFRPLPDDRLAEVCEVLLEALEKIVAETNDMAVYEESLPPAISCANEMAGGTK